MKIFYIPSKKYIALELSKLLNLNLENAEMGQFLDGDLYVQINSNIKKEKCLILGGTNKEELLETTFLAHTLKKEGAKDITAVVPYLSYARQDRNIKGKSLGIKIIGDILKVSGIKKVITIDVHSVECKKIFPIPLLSINPYNIFSKKIYIKNNSKLSLVSPDKGAIDNVKNFSKALKIKNDIPIFYIEKKRSAKNIKIIKSTGIVLKDVILVDDILNSGDTLLEAVKEIKKRGAKNIVIVVTHALFSGHKWKKLWALGVKKLYCTDSVGRRVNDKRVQYIRSSEILYEYLK